MTPSPNSGPHGLLLIDKPEGVTSAGVVREVKRRLGVKVGHLGTLDPFATGLLPLGLGEGLKIVPFLNQEGKAYTGTIALGRATDTLDATGEVTEQAPIPADFAARLADVAARFHGEIRQVPPMYSAIKKDGTPLYTLARKGVELELEPRSVTIEEISLAPAAADAIRIDVRCSKGTYVRSLARDVAAALGTVGHLRSLRRTAFGRFDVAHAVAVASVQRAAALPVIAPRDALPEARELFADEAMLRAVRLGQQSALARLAGPRGVEEVAKLIAPAGTLAAILGAAGSSWKILRVLVPGD